MARARARAGRGPSASSALVKGKRKRRMAVLCWIVASKLSPAELNFVERASSVSNSFPSSDKFKILYREPPIPSHPEAQLLTSPDLAGI